MAPGCVFDCERVVVLVAAKAISRFYESGVFIVESKLDEVECKLMLRDMWRIFVSKMPSDVRAEVADVSQKIYDRFGSNDADDDDDDADEDEDWNTRKRCVSIVEAFLEALMDISFEYSRFVTDFEDVDGEQYYPRALWHAFFGNLNKTVRQAAFSVHERYIREFVHDRNVDDFETFKIPVGSLFFSDELARASLRRKGAHFLPPMEQLLSHRKRSLDSDDEAIAPPAKSYRAESEVATAAHDALVQMVGDGIIVASAAVATKIGVIGQWCDAFMQRLSPDVATGIASASGAAYNFFRSQVQEQ